MQHMGDLYGHPIISLAVRLEAIQAITKINKPEAWHFVETLMEEKNPALQEALDKIIHERTGTLP